MKKKKDNKLPLTWDNIEPIEFPPGRLVPVFSWEKIPEIADRMGWGRLLKP